MRNLQKSSVALLLIATAWQGAVCDTRPAGQSCSSFFVSSMRGFGTRFQKATDAGDLECMKEFHAAGDNINQHNRFGYSPIHNTAFDGNVDALELIIQFGADLNRVQAEDGTALSMGACRGNLEYVKVLLAAGADKLVTNNKGDTPLSKVCTCSSCSNNTANELKSLLGAGCAVLSGTDFPSQAGILNDGKKDITSTIEECCAKCAQHPSCKVWTRVRDSTGGSIPGECWLRDFKPSQKSCPWCDSGLSSCVMLQQTDLPSSGGILNAGSNSIAKSNEECCKWCNDRADCKAWTRIQKDTQFNRAGECWLRNFVPEQKYCADCVSGFKP